jgi:Tfp pilus assembly protein PilN
MNANKVINLLPPELQYGFFKKIVLYNASHPKKSLIYSLGSLSILILLVSLNQTIFTNSYARKAKEAEQSLRQLQAQHKEATGLMNKIAQNKQVLSFQISLLELRHKFLERQYNSGHHWAATLKELKRLVPENVWFTAIKTEGYYLKISGGAFNEKQVSDFMVILRKSPAFSNVSFNYTQGSKVGSTKVVLFELTCNYNLQFIGAKL